MPELPEVETVCRYLNRHLLGTSIITVELFREGLRYPFPETLDCIEGSTITAIERRAKYILCHFDCEQTLLLHLGMSGRLYVVNQETTRQLHEHVRIWVSDTRYLSFHDPRRFGMLLLMPTATSHMHPLLQHLGVEPLDDAFDGAYLYARCTGRKAPIKSLLMQQMLVVGVGNIYASESLFRAGIHPLKEGKDVLLAECQRLAMIIKEVLYEAIEAGGSSFRDYRQADGTPGYFQQQLHVYGRAQQPCHHCGTPITQCVVAGRSTFYCHQCQPL